LKNVGYYRLSGYWFGFKNPDDTFKSNTEFDVVWSTYVFDRQFRLLVLDAVERVEIFVRTSLAYELSQVAGPFGYLEHVNLPRLSEGRYREFIDKCSKSYNLSRERFIEHFKDRYGIEHGMPPYWMIVETMDFGQILTLYRGTPVDVRNTISSKISVSSKVFESWLICLNTVRNICAHHGRLWNRILGVKPVIPDDELWHDPYEVLSGRVFSVLSILSYLLDQVAPNTAWRSRLFSLLDNYPSIPRHHMGFREGWEKSLIWSKWLASSV
jgi:abortive infection bacteriophage resistance protein